MKNAAKEPEYPENLVRDLGVSLICGSKNTSLFRKNSSSGLKPPFLGSSRICTKS